MTLGACKALFEMVLPLSILHCAAGISRKVLVQEEAIAIRADLGGAGSYKVEHYLYGPSLSIYEK